MSIFSNIKVRLFDGEGHTKAFADVTVSGQMTVTGIKVVEGKNGLFIGMPSYKAKSGEYKDIVFPTTKETRTDLQKQILESYAEAIQNAE